LWGCLTLPIPLSQPLSPPPPLPNRKRTKVKLDALRTKVQTPSGRPWPGSIRTAAHVAMIEESVREQVVGARGERG
jgi:hypothetical protein